MMDVSWRGWTHLVSAGDHFENLGRFYCGEGIVMVLGSVGVMCVGSTVRL